MIMTKALISKCNIAEDGWDVGEEAAAEVAEGRVAGDVNTDAAELEVPTVVVGEEVVLIFSLEENEVERGRVERGRVEWLIFRRNKLCRASEKDKEGHTM